VPDIAVALEEQDRVQQREEEDFQDIADIVLSFPPHAPLDALRLRVKLDEKLATR
jgi:hypothetical protein